MLMSGDDAKVSLVMGDEDEECFGAGDEYEGECEYEWEYEDGGLRVGTVSAAADLERSREDPREGRLEEKEVDESCEGESDFKVDGGGEEEAAGGVWWDLRSESPELEDAGVITLLAGVLRRPPPRGPPRPGRPAAKGQWTREKQGTATEQRWEEARHRARLRGVTDGGLTSEDDDEGQLGGWRLEFFEPP
jgi:hypothetical protein